MNLDSILDKIARSTVSKVAASLGITKQALTARFSRLADDDPIKIRYRSLVSRGRPKIHATTRDRVREAVRRHRAKKKRRE